MDKRVVGAVALALVLGGAGGWLARPVPSAPDCAIGPQAVAEPPSRAPTVAPTVAAGDCSQLEDELKMLQWRLKLTENQLQGLAREHLGDPVEWPDEVAPMTSPDEFEAQLARAIEACDPGVRLIGTECAEPPCLAMLDIEDPKWHGKLINDCPEWHEHYSRSIASASGKVECPDGSTQRFQLIGASGSLVLGDPADETERKNRSKRFSARIDEIKRNWNCD